MIQININRVIVILKKDNYFDTRTVSQRLALTLLCANTIHLLETMTSNV